MVTDFSLFKIKHESSFIALFDLVDIKNCTFHQNTNIKTMIALSNIKSASFGVTIDSCTFSHNHVMSIISDHHQGKDSQWQHPVSLDVHNELYPQLRHKK